MAKKIALVTTGKHIVSGLTVFMESLKNCLEDNGYEVDLIYPIPHAFDKIRELSLILSYAFTREELKKYDLIIGNGYGLTGAVDLEIMIIDNIHSTGFGANQAFEEAFQHLTESEIVYLDEALKKLVGATHQDIPLALKTRVNESEVDKIVAQKADAIIAVSPATGREVGKYFDIPAADIHVVPNGVDERWYEARKYQTIISDQPVNIVYTGRASYSIINIFWKGFDRIIGALARIKNSQKVAILHLGKSKSQKLYRDVLEEAGVICVFDVENQNLPTYLREGDIYIQASRYEACSLSLMEAMASGMVPVVFESGMVAAQVIDGVNGYIVSSIDEMSARIEQLINDSDMRFQMGRAASRMIHEHYSLNTMCNGYLQIIEKLLNS